MRIGVIGVGISGMSVAKLLDDRHEVQLFEECDRIGGIAKTKDINGIAYHLVGGHCFNSKNEAVMDFVFKKILAKKHWHLVKRKAKILFKNHIVSYPIEFAVKEIAQFDEQLAIDIIQDFILANDEFDAKSADNYSLAQWFVGKFGKTLAEEYLIPYNRKIWNRDPESIDPAWLEGKLPVPNKQDLIRNLLSSQQDTMSHAQFYYPNSNNQNTFLEALSTGLEINLNTRITSIEKLNDKWLLNGKYQFDHVISTMPLNKLPFLIKDTPDEIKDHAQKLKYNRITTMLWETKNLEDRTWTYYPDKDTIFHRHIHIGNFFLPSKNFSITESVGDRSEDEMVEAGRAIDYLLKPISYHQSDYAYVVYDKNYQTSTIAIKNYLQQINIDTLGRFGQWEYFNMDICIENAMIVCEKIINGR